MKVNSNLIKPAKLKSANLWLFFIQSLAFTLQVDTKTIEIFNRFRQKRNISDYERIGLTSKTEVTEMIQLASRLRVILEEWLRQNHPELV